MTIKSKTDGYAAAAYVTQLKSFKSSTLVKYYPLGNCLKAPFLRFVTSPSNPIPGLTDSYRIAK